MQMERHESAQCPTCGAILWFGTKSEGSGWSVYYECTSCSFEKRVGRVSVAEVGSRDAVRKRAEEMGGEF